mgnify:CR=1 FL=1
MVRAERSRRGRPVVTPDQPNPSSLAFPDGRFEWQRYFPVTGATLVVQASRVRVERSHLYTDLKAYLREPNKEGLVHLDGDNFAFDKGEERRKYARGVHHMLPDILKGTKEAPAYQDRDLNQDLYLFYLNINRSFNALDAKQLRDIAPTREVNWLLPPFLIEKQPVFLFGLGGAGKSLLALGMGLSLQTGQTVLPGLRPKAQMNVAYLNWETDEEEIRMRQLYFGQDLGNDLYHIPCALPIHTMVTDLTRLLHEWDIRLLIIDSLLLAAGGATEDHAAAFFAALRRLGRASLVVAHTAKNTEGKTIYGSVFFENLARNVFEVRGKDSDNELVTALYHRKGNNSRRLAPLGFRFTFGDPFSVRAADVRADGDFTQGVSTLDQIEGIISANGNRPVSRDILLSELGALSPDTPPDRIANRLRKTLHDHKGKRLQQIMRAGDTQNEYWALAARSQ